MTTTTTATATVTATTILPKLIQVFFMIVVTIHIHIHFTVAFVPKSISTSTRSTSIINTNINMIMSTKKDSNQQSKVTSSSSSIRNNIVSLVPSIFKHQQQEQPKDLVNASVSSNFHSTSFTIIPKIKVKKRPIVSLDPITGKYIPHPPLEPPPSSLLLKRQQKTSSSSSFASKWTNLKDNVYDTIDAITIMNKNNNSNKNNKRNLIVGYSDTVEKMKKNPSSTTSTSLSKDTSESTKKTKLVIRQYESSLLSSSLNQDRSNGDNYFRSNVRNSFDNVKDGIYDLFSRDNNNNNSSSNNNNNNNNNMKKTPIQNLDIVNSSSSSLSSFKPVTKKSTNKDETIVSITPYLPDLDSTNPIKVLKAKYAIKVQERKQKHLEDDQRRRETISNIKQNIYNVVDIFQRSYHMILTLPKQIDDTIISIDDTFEQATIQSKKTVNDIQTIPNKIQKTINDAKVSVENTQKATIYFAEEVKSIPQKIEESVEDTKKSIQETKQGVDDLVHKVEDVTFEAKVLVGIEKPKPKPPPLPPVKTSSDIAMDVAGAAAKLTGKALFAIGKGTIGLTAHAAKLAFKAASASKDDNNKKIYEKEEVVVASIDGLEQTKSSLSSGLTNTADNNNSITTEKNKEPKSDTKELVLDTNPLASIREIDPLLDREVADALRLAEESLESAKQEKSSPPTKISSMEIDLALEKARFAASQARKDAEELESMLQKRKEYLMTK